MCRTRPVGNGPEAKFDRKSTENQPVRDLPDSRLHLNFPKAKDRRAPQAGVFQTHRSCLRSCCPPNLPWHPNRKSLLGDGSPPEKGGGLGAPQKKGGSPGAGKPPARGVRQFFASHPARCSSLRTSGQIQCCLMCRIVGANRPIDFAARPRMFGTSPSTRVWDLGPG